MLIDDVTIEVSAGNGGRGAVAFDKNLQALGPAGGGGGKGGSVYAEGVSDLGALQHFRFKKRIAAKNGANGKGQFCDGPDSDDVILKIPVGTVIHNRDTHVDEEITAIGQRICIARGGKGGRGNFHFKSSRNTSPTQFQTGLPGEVFSIRLELKLIADVGLIGFPNAGKSSLLNELTNAQSKVANYPFTTLEPNLGAYYDLIIADLPGLIEGASENKGLGVKFLRHIERTKTLFHLVSTESDDPARDYAIIRKELGAHNKELLEKKEYLFLSKSDGINPADLKKKLTALKKLNPTAMPISIYDMESMDAVKNILAAVTEEKHVKTENTAH